MADPYEHILGDRTLMFRAALEQELAAAGAHVDDEQRGAVLPDGSRLDFDNLARVAAQCDSYEEMRAMLQRHFRIMTSPVISDNLISDDARARLRVRLVPDAGPEELLQGGLARPFGPDLHARLAIDLPDTVNYPGSREAIPVPGTMEELWQIAHANTREELNARGLEVERSGPVHLLYSESYFTSAVVFFLGEMLPKVAGQEFGAAKALLFSVPDRHTVLLLPVNTREEYTAGLQTIVPFTVKAFQQEPGAISLHVYVWDAQGITNLTHLEPDGEGGQQIRVVLPQHLREWLG